MEDTFRQVLCLKTHTKYVLMQQDLSANITFLSIRLHLPSTKFVRPNCLPELNINKAEEKLILSTSAYKIIWEGCYLLKYMAIILRETFKSYFGLCCCTGKLFLEMLALRHQIPEFSITA